MQILQEVNLSLTEWKAGALSLERMPRDHVHQCVHVSVRLSEVFYRRKG